MKTALKLAVIIGIVFGLWVASARSNLFQAALVETEKMRAWLKGKSQGDFAETWLSSPAITVENPAF